MTTPGTYYFDYIAWNDSYWYGNYTIYVEEGTSGGLLFDGADGDDLYFELACYSFGPDFYVWSEEFAYLTLDNRYFEQRISDLNTERNLAESTRTGIDTRPARLLNAAAPGPIESEKIITGKGYLIILRYGKRQEL